MNLQDVYSLAAIGLQHKQIAYLLNLSWYDYTRRFDEDIAFREAVARGHRDAILDLATELRESTSPTILQFRARVLGFEDKETVAMDREGGAGATAIGVETILEAAKDHDISPEETDRFITLIQSILSDTQ